MAKAGSNYIEVPHGSKAVNEFHNPHLFPMLYPTLFPYGVGGMGDDRRRSRLGLKRHVKHLFSSADRRFQEHYSFLFTAFNMIQRHTLLLRTHYKAERANFDYIAAQFGTVSAASVHIVSERIASGDYKTSNSNEERRVLRLMKEVNAINAHVPGSSQSKLVMRNQIRALMVEKGMPSFYITINPADVYNPLVKFLAGDEIDLDNMSPQDVPDYIRQSITIAKNPAVAAQFFNIYMKAFIKTILAYDPKQQDREGGALGIATAYYGTVEAQGRGTLHCHMMVWVAGSLNPNEIKAKAMEDGGNEEFQKRLISFLEDTISTSVPPDPRPELETPLSTFHPSATRGAGPNIPPADRQDADAKDFHNLAERCQRHRHTFTCYKYWKGYPEKKECRFDLDESNATPYSQFDPETGEFTMRCLDGMVNHFNDTMLKAIRCNMDIKFISSGPAAKAVIYYITDYITKSQLQAHVAYAALEGAVQKLGEYDPEDDDLSSRAKRLLQKCAHSMISNQELSAQQVASYLMEHEDHFTSHEYVNLYWTSLESHINHEDPSPECYPASTVTPTSELTVPDEPDPEGGPSESNVIADNSLVNPDVDDDLDCDPEEDHSPVEQDPITLVMDLSGKLVPSANQACDYQKRGDVLADVNVWDFVAHTSKVRPQPKKAAKKKNKSAAAASGSESTDESDHEPTPKPALDQENPLPDARWNHHNILDFTGRPMPQIPFLETHLESDRFVVQVRPYLKRKVPVPIGPAIPRRDIEASRHKHARLMLILFKPWRNSEDLRQQGQSWVDAYEQFLDTCSEEIRSYIDNMQLLHECKDSRDAHFNNRRNRRNAGLTPDLMRGSRGSNEFGEETDESLIDHLTSIESCQSQRSDTSRGNIIAALESARESGMLSDKSESSIQRNNEQENHIQIEGRSSDQESLWQKNYDARKEFWKKAAKAVQDNNIPAKLAAQSSDSVQGGIQDGSAFRDEVVAPLPVSLRDVDAMLDRASPPDAGTPSELETIINAHNLNTEQTRAFSIVANHSQSEAKVKPLRMYLGGQGGTGKSRVIDALRDFFVGSGQSRRFRLSSFTGVAARNISGMTLHAALMLGEGIFSSSRSAKAKKDLIAITAFRPPHRHRSARS
jgi:hypothetical protein